MIDPGISKSFRDYSGDESSESHVVVKLFLNMLDAKKKKNNKQKEILIKICMRHYDSKLTKLRKCGPAIVFQFPKEEKKTEINLSDHPSP